ncbi:hypothetical protein RJ641_004862 [Dillenia turbinata]|uniref:Uncharacterized protein n=1 Tax=Dillenia turbinata TaxID=194707 RepID=A0AAN8VFZ5_9MAGN
MNITQALVMLPYSLSTCLEALSFSSLSPNLTSTWSRIAGPPGCTIQKREFQSQIPIGVNTSSKHFSMQWNVNPASRKCRCMASCESGRIVCAAHTSWNSGRSMDMSGSAPTMTAAAPSLKRACAMRVSMWVSEGPRKIMGVISEHTTRTRAQALFSARSLDRRRTVPPAKQPCWNTVCRWTDGLSSRSLASR